MIGTINNQLQCEECQYYRESDGYSWCTFWSLDDGDAEVDPRGYCSNALEKPEGDWDGR